ncbi:MAG: hypothetical protein ACYC2P_05585 [Paludibacteraceae bacterium]
MRKKFFISVIVLVLILGFNSCKLGTESNYTPKLTLVTPAKINTDSTLRMSYTPEGNIKLDSLHVNDTVTVTVIGEGISNSLTSFSYTVTDPADIQVMIPDSIQKYLDPSSDFANGNLFFPKNIVWMNLPFKFVAKQPKDKVKINFLLQSDAVNVSNQAGIQLEFPVKP